MSSHDLNELWENDFRRDVGATSPDKLDCAGWKAGHNSRRTAFGSS